MSAQPTLHTPALKAQAQRINAELHPEPDYATDPAAWDYYMRQIAHSSCIKRGFTNTFARTDFLKEVTKIVTARGHMGNARWYLRIMSQQLKARGYGKRVYANQRPVRFDNEFYPRRNRRFESPFGKPIDQTPDELAARTAAALATIAPKPVEDIPVTDKTAEPTTNELSEYAPRTADNKPADHWIDDPKVRGAFWANVTPWIKWSGHDGKLDDFAHDKIGKLHDWTDGRLAAETRLVKEAILDRFHKAGREMVDGTFQAAVGYPSLRAAWDKGLSDTYIRELIDEHLKPQPPAATQAPETAQGAALAIPPATPIPETVERASDTPSSPVKGQSTPPAPEPETLALTTIVNEQTGEIIAFDPNRAIARVKGASDLVSRMREQNVLVKDIDYGVVPGVDKPVLKKPGAEKLLNAFEFYPEFKPTTNASIDWRGGFFAYEYECVIRNRQTGRIEGSGIGNCNSMEKKYRWRWVSKQDVPAGMDIKTLKTRGGKISEFDFAVAKAETGGKYGKPAEYWQQFTDAIEAGTAKLIDRDDSKGNKRKAWEIDSTLYRLPNDEDIYDQVNTISKMAQKRALVAAVLNATGASAIFTQDENALSDFGYVTEIA